MKSKNIKILCGLKTIWMITFVLVAVMILGNIPVSAASNKSITVKTQVALDKALSNSKVTTITIETSKKRTFVIDRAEGPEKKKLVISAPKANVTNKLKFKSVTILKVGAYREEIDGNNILVKGSVASLTIGKGIEVGKITTESSKANIVVEDDGKIDSLICKKKSSNISLTVGANSEVSITLSKKTNIVLKGETTAKVAITCKAKNSSVSTSVPAEIITTKNMTVSLEKGSEGTVINKSKKNLKVKINNESATGGSNSSFIGKQTSIKKNVTSTSIYTVYEAPSNVVQFKGPDGSFYFAVAGDKKVTVYKVKNGEVLNEKVELSKPHTIFGTITCDEDGYFFLVTGENNEDDDYMVNTVFVSKYDGNGKHIKTAGYTGRTGEIQDDFNTKYPFDCGCAAAVMNGIITVNYSRGMYNGHQSNNAFAMYTSDLTPLEFETFYNSHSFGQRAITVPETNTFILASHGDWAPRADRIGIMRVYNGKMISYEDYQLFHFWGPNRNENNTFACLGGIAKLSYDRLVLVGDSVVSGDGSAPNDSREIFIQIFNPLKDLNSEEAYYTTGTRSGYRETNEGRIDFTDHGVKWLTSYGKGWFVSNVQFTVTDDDRIVVLYELYKSDTAKNDWLDRYNCEYQGVYYMVLDANGEIISDAKMYDKNALLNPFQMPVFADGKIYWVDNKYEKEDRYNEKNMAVYLYELDLGQAPEGWLSLKDNSDVKNIVAINRSSFPDDCFREYVCAFADINNDMQLDNKEIENVYKIDIGHYREVFGEDKFLVKDLKGIEYFTSLEYLNCSENLITQIDVSKNTALSHLDCSRNQLTGLDVKNNKALVYLDCHENLITNLDLSNNVKLDYFNCGANELKSIDVGKNTELTVFICDGNEFTGIDVSKNLKLVEFNCACNWGITSIDVKNNTNLEALICYCASIKEIDISKNMELKNLNYGINQISSIDISNNTKLEFLGSGFNQLESIDLSHNPLLKVIELSENKLTKLDLSKNILLERLYCDDNKLTSLDISNNPGLVELNCTGNLLQSLDISGNKNLKDGLTYDAGLLIIK